MRCLSPDPGSREICPYIKEKKREEGAGTLTRALARCPLPVMAARRHSSPSRRLSGGFEPPHTPFARVLPLSGRGHFYYAIKTERHQALSSTVNRLMKSSAFFCPAGKGLALENPAAVMSNSARQQHWNQKSSPIRMILYTSPALQFQQKNNAPTTNGSLSFHLKSFGPLTRASSMTLPLSSPCGSSCNRCTCTARHDSR